MYLQQPSTAKSATTIEKFQLKKCWLEHPDFSWLKAVKK